MTAIVVPHITTSPPITPPIIALILTGEPPDELSPDPVSEEFGELLVGFDVMSPGSDALSLGLAVLLAPSAGSDTSLDPLDEEEPPRLGGDEVERGGVGVGDGEEVGVGFASTVGETS